MDLADFAYDLPSTSIAQHPASTRDGSRLLVIDRPGGTWADHTFSRLPELLRPGDCVVVNDSRVLPARVLAVETASGRGVELLFVSRRDERRWTALVRPGRRCRPGAELQVGDGAPVRLRVVTEEADGTRLLERGDGTIEELMAAHGLPPLPPYIVHHVHPDADDLERYQTVYARHPGSIAAPTAGLHFTPELLAALRRAGIEIQSLTLHVGPGTFRPIRAARVEHHQLAGERVTIATGVADAINRARAEKRRVVAVGTTTTRALEGSVDGQGQVLPQEGMVDLFITPGHRFRVVDALITNFHLPRSSLLVLVAAFAGRELILKAYRHAIDAGYRFYSYGDACLIT